MGGPVPACRAYLPGVITMCTCPACFVPHLPHPAGFILRLAPGHSRGSFWDPLLPSTSHPVSESRQLCLQGILSLCHLPMRHLRWPFLWAPCSSPGPTSQSRGKPRTHLSDLPLSAQSSPRAPITKAPSPSPCWSVSCLSPPVCSIRPPQDLCHPSNMSAVVPVGSLFSLPGGPCPQVFTGLPFSIQLPTITAPPLRGLPRPCPSTPA